MAGLHRPVRRDRDRAGVERRTSDLRRAAGLSCLTHPNHRSLASSRPGLFDAVARRLLVYCVRISKHPVYDNLEFIPDAIVIVGPDGRITLSNAQAERLFGYARAELLGQPVEVLLP